jgi:arylsulfatase A-like enzyme
VGVVIPVPRIVRVMRAGLVLASFPALLALGACSHSPPERIVLVVVDTLRRDALSCYGGSTSTPNIDALAAQGQLFTNAVGSFHQTTMSMGAMFTGRTPSLESGKRQGTELGCIPVSVPTLPQVLRESGYWTIGVVSNPFLFRPSGFERGFDDWVEVGLGFPAPFRRGLSKIQRNPLTRASGPVNTAVAEALKRRPRDRFFLYVHYMDVHDHKLRQESYWATVAKMDAALGELLQELKEERLSEDTVILLTSDHGERLEERHLVDGRPGHFGNPSFEEVLRVPLLVSSPQLPDPSRLVRSQDIFALTASLAGLHPRAPQELEPDELLLTEGAWRTYLKGDWKSFTSRAHGTQLLVNLREDPGEQRDVSDQNPSVAEAHRKRVTVLSEKLGARNAPRSELSADDRARLQALGYLE